MVKQKRVKKKYKKLPPHSNEPHPLTNAGEISKPFVIAVVTLVTLVGIVILLFAGQGMFAGKAIHIIEDAAPLNKVGIFAKNNAFTFDNLEDSGNVPIKINVDKSVSAVNFKLKYDSTKLEVTACPDVSVLDKLFSDGKLMVYSKVNCDTPGVVHYQYVALPMDNNILKGEQEIVVLNLKPKMEGDSQITFESFDVYDEAGNKITGITSTSTKVSTSVSSATCTDSDGKDYYKLGEVTYIDDSTNQQAKIVDACVSDTQVKEQYCENGERKEETVDCPVAGESCVLGKCVKPAASCDTYKKYGTFGTLTSTTLKNVGNAVYLLPDKTTNSCFIRMTEKFPNVNKIIYQLGNDGFGYSCEEIYKGIPIVSAFGSKIVYSHISNQAVLGAFDTQIMDECRDKSFTSTSFGGVDTIEEIRKCIDDNLAKFKGADYTYDEKLNCKFVANGAACISDSQCISNYCNPSKVCAVAPAKETNCGDDIDNDKNGVKDCADTACMSKDVCKDGTVEKGKACDNSNQCKTLSCYNYKCTLSNGATCTTDDECGTNENYCNPSKTCAPKSLTGDCTAANECLSGVCGADKKCVSKKKPDGEGCNLGTECTSGGCINNKCAAPIKPGDKCTKVSPNDDPKNFITSSKVELQCESNEWRVKPGQTCKVSEPCVGAASCEADKCRLKVGSWCNSQICLAGLTCDTANKKCIVAPKESSCTDGKDNNLDRRIDCADTTCAADPACNSLEKGKSCSTGNQCKSTICYNYKCTLNNGAACTTDDECGTDKNICHPTLKVCVIDTLKKVGEACNLGNNCETGVCGADKKCATAPKKADGEVCKLASECTSNTCTGGKCVAAPKKADGTTCKLASECISNICTGGKCVAPAPTFKIKAEAVTNEISHTKVSSETGVTTPFWIFTTMKDAAGTIIAFNKERVSAMKKDTPYVSKISHKDKSKIKEKIVVIYDNPKPDKAKVKLDKQLKVTVGK